MRSLMVAVALVGSMLIASGALAQSTQTTPSSGARPGSAPAVTAPAAPAAAAPTSQGALIDINSASTDQLQVLTGIGPARAEAIVKGRPYKGKDELHRKNIIPESVYEGIKDKIVARQS